MRRSFAFLGERVGVFAWMCIVTHILKVLSHIYLYYLSVFLTLLHVFRNSDISKLFLRDGCKMWRRREQKKVTHDGLMLGSFN